MNKSLILNRVKLFFQFHTDVELATFLGISKSTLSNWYKRNTIDYDLLFSKCEQIDKNWLLMGEGEMLKAGISVSQLPLSQKPSDENKAQSEFLEEIRELYKENRELYKENRELRRELDELKDQGGDIVVGA